MIQPQRVRTAAFRMLYQLDAAGAADPPSDAELDAVRAAAESNESADEHPEARVLRKAEALALAAYADRGQADALFEELSPAWPVSRQPAVDRAILRLAHHEMASGRTPPRVAIDEAIELARAYSTEKSPAFVNALLDEAMRWLEMNVQAETDSAAPATRPETEAC
ncbi:MAG: transcription antitermination factor NusB [Planctomycetota bacterium]